MPTIPPKWVAPLAVAPQDQQAVTGVDKGSLGALVGFGNALGYFLPAGIQRAQEATRRIAKIGV